MSSVIVGGMVGTLILCGMWFVMFLLVPSADGVSERLVKSIAPGLGLVALAGFGGFIVSRRSRTLWLRSGLGRSELFRLCEAQAWHCFALSAAPMLVFLGAGWMLEPSSGTSLTTFFLFQLATGACLLYLGLMHVQGWRFADLALAFVIGLSWMIAMSWAQSPLRSPLLVPAATVVAFVFAMLLRLAGMRRWQRIDWFICRPPRTPSHALHAGS